MQASSAAVPYPPAAGRIGRASGAGGVATKLVLVLAAQFIGDLHEPVHALHRKFTHQHDTGFRDLECCVKVAL